MSDFQTVKVARQRACGDRVVDVISGMTLGEGMKDVVADQEALTIITFAFARMISANPPEKMEGMIDHMGQLLRSFVPILHAEDKAHEALQKAPIVPECLHTAQEVRGTVAFTIAGSRITTPRGVVTVQDAPGMLSLLMQVENHPTKIGIMAYDPQADGGTGWLVQFDAPGALAFGKSLVALAAQAAEG